MPTKRSSAPTLASIVIVLVLALACVLPQMSTPVAPPAFDPTKVALDLLWKM